MNAQHVLMEAQELIADPDHWCQEQLAMDANGESTSVEDSSVVKRCAMGAIAAIDCVLGNVGDYLDRAANQLFEVPNYVIVNDTHDHADVMRMFDLAIELAEETGETNA